MGSLKKATHLVLSALVCTQAGWAESLYGLDIDPAPVGWFPSSGVKITQADIRAKMKVVAGDAKWFRIYTVTKGMEAAPAIIKNEFKKHLVAGAWISADKARNQAEIDSLVNLCKQGLVDVAVIGSEALQRGEVDSSTLQSYVAQFKVRAPGIKVSVADTFSQLLNHPEIVQLCDFIYANFWPYWQGVSFDHGIAQLHNDYMSLKHRYGSKPVWVSETGWGSFGNQFGAAIPSVNNAWHYFRDFVSWGKAVGVPYFYTEAIDVWYKGHSGSNSGFEGSLGIRTVNGAKKAGMQRVFDGETVPDCWSGNILVDGPGVPKVWFTRVPAKGSYDRIYGRVTHVAPAKYFVLLYIRVNGLWWTKPTYQDPKTKVWPRGDWDSVYVTGGMDMNADAVAAFLVPQGFDPVILQGWDLPSYLFEGSVSYQIYLR